MGYDFEFIFGIALFALLSSGASVLLYTPAKSPVKIFFGSFLFGALIGLIFNEMPQYKRFALIAAGISGFAAKVIADKGKIYIGRFIESKTPQKLK